MRWLLRLFSLCGLSWIAASILLSLIASDKARVKSEDAQIESPTVSYFPCFITEHDVPEPTPEAPRDDPEYLRYLERLNSYSPYVPSIEEMVLAASDIYENLSPELIDSVIFYESSYDRNSTGSSPDISGLMQVSTRYHQARADKLGVNLKSDYGNILTGCDYLNELYEKYENLELALMCYNQGEVSAVRTYNSGVVSSYARKIIDRTEKLQGGEPYG